MLRMDGSFRCSPASPKVTVEDILQDPGSSAEARLSETRENFRQGYQLPFRSLTENTEKSGNYQTTSQCCFPCPPIIQDHQIRTEIPGQQDRFLLTCLEPLQIWRCSRIDGEDLQPRRRAL